VELAERVITRYWRRRPCPALAGALLPKIVGGAYFSTPAGAVHWLDLAPELVAEALRRALTPPTLRRRGGRHARPASSPRPRDEGSEDLPLEDLLLLAHDMRDRLAEEPMGAVTGPLFGGLLFRLMELAHRGRSWAARRRGAEALTAVCAALPPDRRGHRRPRGHDALTARSRERRERGERLRDGQADLRDYCAQVDSAALPPPLRGASAQISVFARGASVGGVE
jgi:hypothetical protein